MVKDVPDFPGFDRAALPARIDLLKLWRPTTDPRKQYPAAPPAVDAAKAHP